MQDKQLYQRILGLGDPWYVTRIELDMKAEEVHVYVSHHKGLTWACPECDKQGPLHDHQRDRTWRHLDTCQLQTLLHAQPPRMTCPVHGVRVVPLPWAEPFARFTALFEAVAINWLREASRRAVARRLRLSWDEVHEIMQRAVRRGLLRRKAAPLPRIGIDEKAFRKRHKYVTIAYDLDKGTVLYVNDARRKASLDPFWSTLTTAQIESIEAVAMDMWDPFIDSVREHVPDAEKKIVFDKFHIAQHLCDAVNKVRVAENKALLEDGDKRLVGTKFQWLKNPDSFDRKGWRNFKQLRQSDLKTARAWGIKEAAMNLFGYRYEGAARRYFKWWYFWATHSRLKPIIAVARMLKRRLDNVLTYLKHHLTNAGSEAINAKIQWVKYTARGFRNIDNFKTAIYFHCGGLDLYPKQSPTH